MNDIAIRVESISKQFQIGKRQASYKTLRDTIADAIVAPFRRAGRLLRGEAAGAAELDETIWALKDISFEIKRGEVVGIIGRNGAGKSTLLKILSRISEPSEGFAELRGRLGSLLEVGTGFHPELTGRDNIYLNGVILGMKRTEIDKKFDEIVAFAEVEKFIDTPVKHYSSGMYLRLAFGVAAYLDPEILIVDEVLAVGDARFQKKCLNKIEDVGRQGRTVLFVSHNMPAITRLCNRAILLDGGRIVQDGPATQVVKNYLNTGRDTTAERSWSDTDNAPGDEISCLRAVRVKNEEGHVADSLDIRRPILLEMEYDVLTPGYVLLPHFGLFNDEGMVIFVTVDVDPAWRGRQRPQGRYKSTAWIPGNLLNEGTYFVGPCMITIDPTHVQFWEPDAVSFLVVDSVGGDTARGDYSASLKGVIRPLLKWTTEVSTDGKHLENIIQRGDTAR